jgi:mono/diheme cytochrome c family protein
MRSIIFVLLAIASLWVLYLGLRDRPAPITMPDDHNHSPARTGTATQSEGAAATETVEFDNGSQGYQVYRSRGCATCHGADALGSRMGPSLAEARIHYDRKSMTEYLKDPEKAIANDGRLLAMQSQYPRIQMPAADDLPADELDALLTFVLEPTVR